MIKKLKEEFPYRFSKELAAEFEIGYRTLIRKARELGIDKELGFLEKNRKKITQMAIKARPLNPTSGLKGWSVPNSENTRFIKGQISP